MTKPCSVCGTACSLTCSCRQRSYCSQACLKADWRTHKTNCPKVEERHISQAKGRGLVATRNIKKGSVVLEEAPLLLLKKVRDFEKKILEEHKKLTKSAKAKYGSLSSLARQDRKKVVNIWFSNAINTRVLSSDDDMEGVFYRVALINHSCSPNTVINITEDRKIKIVSVEDIKKGEEILLNYLKPTAGIGEEMLKFQRQKKLRSEFQFSCECRICSLSGQELQRNQHFKRELAALSASLPTLRDFNNVENLKFSLYLLSEITKYMKKLGSETIRDYSQSLHKCYFLAKILQVHGVTTKENPQELRESARKAAEELGETYIRVFNERDKMYDVKISEVISKIINQRTKIVYVYYPN